MNNTNRFHAPEANEQYPLNFRDVSSNSSKIKPVKVFRSSLLRNGQNEIGGFQFLQSCRVSTIIDLRAPWEVSVDSYHRYLPTQIEYLNIPFDPWNQPSWFRDQFSSGTNEQIAYRYFSIACKQQVREVLSAIIDNNNGASLIHCHAGKDRTGIIVTILYLLTNSIEEEIYREYLESKADTSKDLLDIFLDVVREEGGVIKYLLGCGFSLLEQQQLSQNLMT